MAISGNVDDRQILRSWRENTDSYYVAPLLQLKESPFGMPILSWRRMFGLIIRRLDSGQYMRIGVVQGSFIENTEHLHDNHFIRDYWDEALKDIRATEEKDTHLRSTRWHPVDLRDEKRTEVTIV